MNEKEFKKKFQVLLLSRDFAAAKRLVEDSGFPQKKKEELSNQVEEARKRFWRNFFEEDLYAGIPAIIVFVQPAVWAFSILNRHILGGCLLSGAISAGMLWFYGKVIRPLWRQLKRSGGMAVFGRDKKWMGRLLWWFGTAWSLLYTGLLVYTLAGYRWDRFLRG